MRKAKKPWYEQDEFWDTIAAFLFNEERRALAPVEVEHILRLLAIEPPKHICDLCCGIGRHSLELAQRGFTVTAIDRTRQYLCAAQGQARAMGLEIEFIRADMREFCRPDTFDAVLNLFTSFGYFEAPDQDRRVVENVHRSLKPGGKLLIDMVGKEVLARIFRARDWQPMGDGLVVQERKVVDDWSRVENRWILVRDGGQQEWVFSHRVYSATELRELLEACGFHDVAVYGSVSGAPYDEKAERLVIVGCK